MIFREIDVHFDKRPCDRAAIRDFRLKINHIVDSIRLRMPRIVSERTIKLNCEICGTKPERDYIDHDGYPSVYVYNSRWSEMPKMKNDDCVQAVSGVIRQALEIIGKYDSGIRDNMPIILRLLDSSNERFYYYRKAKRSHKSRKYMAQAALDIGAGNYASCVMVNDKKGNCERFTVSEFEPVLLDTYLGFDRIDWDKNTVIGYLGPKSVFQYTPKLLES